MRNLMGKVLSKEVEARGKKHWRCQGYTSSCENKTPLMWQTFHNTLVEYGVVMKLVNTEFHCLTHSTNFRSTVELKWFLILRLINLWVFSRPSDGIGDALNDFRGAPFTSLTICRFLFLYSPSNFELVAKSWERGILIYTYMYI